MPSTVADDTIHVVVGVVGDLTGRVLIAQRPLGGEHEGKWEFPGGKVQYDETVQEALHRELQEEIGIEVVTARPLVQIYYNYPMKRVFLDVWRVDAYTGEPKAREHQKINWVKIDELAAYDFLAANYSILQALRLPALYLITDAARFSENHFFSALERALHAGTRLVQIREPRLSYDDFRKFGRKVCTLCHQFGAQVLVNADAAMVKICDADGVHLNSKRLWQLSRRPLPREIWVAASCHDSTELAHAQRIGVDFSVLSPLRKTASHPSTAVLGWDQFKSLCAGVNFPVYALGGLRPDDMEIARRMGAQGLAMISGVWEADSIEDAVKACEGQVVDLVNDIYL